MPPDISLIVSSFERPANLRRCLCSIAVQDVAPDRVEVIVADDGSSDETENVVREFAYATGRPVKFTSHPHESFRLSRCRNEGVVASTAEYLLFADGDCVLPRDHLAIHLQNRRRGAVMAGDCYRLDAGASRRLSERQIRSGELLSLVDRREARRLWLKTIKAKLYELLRVPMRPRLSGNNIAVWRADCERVNGFDENFVGWGLEDKDFQRRLESIGVRTRTILHKTRGFHLWHPPHPTYSRDSKGTANYYYYHSRAGAGARCARGLSERRLAGCTCTTFGRPRRPPAAPVRYVEAR